MPNAIKVISANGMREVIADTRAQFEAGSGQRLDVTVIETGEIKRRVAAGEPYDVIMVPRNVADEFEQQGKVVSGSQVPLVRINLGLAVRADGPPSDTSTPEALKRTFLAAKTVLITDPSTGGVSGVHLMEVLSRLGIAEAMKAKMYPSRGAIHAARVVAGEADLAVQAEHEIRSVEGAAFLPYPAEFQRSIEFVGGVGAASRDVSAAKAYLRFITGPVAAAAMAAHHLRPA